ADRRWDVLPQQPAISYDIAQNRLIVTAAALQGPIFAEAASNGEKIGAFGGLGAPEVSRAGAARGPMIDAKGELRSWWTTADKSAWTLLGSRVAAQYSGYAFPGVKDAKVNGELTRDENMADISGVEIAWEAFSATQANATAAD